MKFKPGDRVVLKREAVKRGLADRILYGTITDIIGIDHIRVKYGNRLYAGEWWAGWWRKERKSDVLQNEPKGKTD